jgi:hypothetical protein
MKASLFKLGINKITHRKSIEEAVRECDWG